MRYRNPKFISLAIVFVLSCSLLFPPSIALSASDKPTGILFYDVFYRYAGEVGSASYRQITDYLKKTKYRFETTYTAAFVCDIYDNDGNNISMHFYPLDNSYDNKDFGNVDKEMLCLLSYKADDKSITINTDWHSTLPEFSVSAKGKGTTFVYDVKSLYDYYLSDMNGIKRDVSWNNDYTSSQSIEMYVESSVRKHFDYPIKVKLRGKNLVIEAVGKDSITTNMIKTGMFISIYEVMKANKNPPVDFDFLISFPLIDKYGNSELGIVMKVTYKSESMAKINWKRFLHLDIEEAADRYWEHPAFSK